MPHLSEVLPLLPYSNFRIPYTLSCNIIFPKYIITKWHFPIFYQILNTPPYAHNGQTKITTSTILNHLILHLPLTSITNYLLSLLFLFILWCHQNPPGEAWKEVKSEQALLYPCLSSLINRIKFPQHSHFICTYLTPLRIFICLHCGLTHINV